jgi:hypothetical protein
MCIFSRSVESVSKTRIFARTISFGQPPIQAIVYQMNFLAGEDLAMILPIPTTPRAPDNSIHFIDLSAEPTFFDKLDAAFPRQQTRRATLGGDSMMKGRSEPLVVHDVGDFQASFVPSHDDWFRLDERFKLPPGTWDRVPQYGDWGFAVFKLKATGDPEIKMPRPVGFRSERRPKQPHPMAFTFPRRKCMGLFFPTVHIHDGQVHPVEEFDHTLYLQSDPSIEPIISRATEWESSGTNLSFLKPNNVIVDSGMVGYRMKIKGRHTNEDVIVGKW